MLAAIPKKVIPFVPCPEITENCRFKFFFYSLGIGGKKAWTQLSLKEKYSKMHLSLKFCLTNGETNKHSCIVNQNLMKFFKL